MTTSAFGEHLRRERELRGIPLEEVCASTRINMRFLEALENGDWSALPGGVFRRGFIRSVSRFLGLNEESMVAEYALETHDSAEPAATVRVVAIDRRHWLLIAGVAVVILFAAAALLGYFRLHRGKAGRTQGIVASAGAAHVVVQTAPAYSRPAASAALPADASNRDQTNPAVPGPSTSDFSAPAGSVPAAPGTAAGAQAEAPISVGPFSLHLQAIRPTRIQVTADGSDVFEGTLVVGEWRNFQASKSLQLFAADGGAIVAQLNGRPVSTGGADGRPLRLAYPPAR
jgi:cytoskeletal protein RodZ